MDTNTRTGLIAFLIAGGLGIVAATTLIAVNLKKLEKKEARAKGNTPALAYASRSNAAPESAQHQPQAATTKFPREEVEGEIWSLDELVKFLKAAGENSVYRVGKGNDNGPIVYLIQPRVMNDRVVKDFLSQIETDDSQPLPLAAIMAQKRRTAQNAREQAAAVRKVLQDNDNRENRLKTGWAWGRFLFLGNAVQIAMIRNYLTGVFKYSDLTAH